MSALDALIERADGFNEVVPHRTPNGEVVLRLSHRTTTDGDVLVRVSERDVELAGAGDHHADAWEDDEHRLGRINHGGNWDAPPVSSDPRMVQRVVCVVQAGLSEESLLSMRVSETVEIPWEKHYRDEKAIAAALRELADKVEGGMFVLIGTNAPL